MMIRQAPPLAREMAGTPAGGMRPAEAGALVALSLLWGSAFLLVDVVLDEVAPFTIVGGRLVIAAVGMLALAFALRRRLPGREAWPLLLFMAAMNNVAPFALITWAQQHVATSLAATLIATMPLFTAVIAAALGVERIGAVKASGVIIGFAGAFVVIGPDLGDLTGSNLLGDIAIIGASACYALATVVARQRVHGDPVGFSAGQMACGALIAVPLALIVDPSPSIDVSARVAVAWLALGVLSSAGAYVIFFWLVQRASATQVSLVAYLIPIVAAVLGWLVLDEAIGWTLLAGLALIFVGMAVVNGTLPRLRRG